jgi:hypothetical protein
MDDEEIKIDDEINQRAVEIFGVKGAEILTRMSIAMARDLGLPDRMEIALKKVIREGGTK